MPVAIKALCLLIGLLSLSACAVTDDTVKLNHQNLPPNANAVPAPAAVTIYVAPVTDNHNANPALIIHKVDVYNHLTTWAYIADQPIADVVQKAVRQGLESIAYNIAPTSTDAYTLQAKINSILQENTTNFDMGQLSLSLNISFTLTDKNGSLIWAQTLIGTGTTATRSLMTRDASIAAAFNAALNNLIQQLQASTTFKAGMMPSKNKQI